MRFAASVAVLATAFTTAILGTAESPAFAADYPTWAEVEAAQRNESAAKAKMEELRNLLAQLKDQVAETQRIAEEKGSAFADADMAYQEAALRAQELRTQAETAEAEADAAEDQASVVVSQFVRNGGLDPTLELLVDGENAEDLLDSLGINEKLSEKSSEVYVQAIQKRNTAVSLGEQADLATELREQLKIEAEQAMIEAQEAATAAEAALEEQLDNQAVLEAQIEVLEEKRAATQADYEAGERERQRLEEERRRLEAERIAREQAANQPPPSSGGGGNTGGGGGGNPGNVTNGWAWPAAGGITSGFGMRFHPTQYTWRLHGGTDIGAGCGAPIRAAHNGTVTYAGWYGTYGNFVMIDHGGGVQTAYAHISPGGIAVGHGQGVSVGQVIAYVGTTGASTGCHLHFEVRVNGIQTDPIPFMRGQGVPI